MGQVLVRRIPDETLARFKDRARREGVSAEALARRLIEREARRPDVREAVARMKELRAMTPLPVGDLDQVLREVRDGDDAGR